MNTSHHVKSVRRIGAWVALALLVGCAAPGEDENYKELERNPDIFHDEPATRDTYSQATPAARKTQYASLDESATLNIVDQETAHDTHIVGPWVGPDGALSSRGSFDRSDWPVITFRPADGRTTHNPSYYSNVALGDDAINPLSAPNPVWQMGEALSGQKPGNWNGDNLTQLAIDPFEFGVTTLSVPVQAISHPPWQQVTTPSTTPDRE